MTWKASLKVQGADPGWPDSDARHPYTRLAILVKEGLRALLAKIAPRRLFEFRRQSIYLGHGRFASNQKYFRWECLGINVMATAGLARNAAGRAG